MYTYVFSIEDVRNVANPNSSLAVRWNSGVQLLGYAGQKFIPGTSPTVNGEQEVHRLLAMHATQGASVLDNLDWAAVGKYVAEVLLMILTK